MEKEKFDLEAFPTSESAVRMLSYVSQGFYDSSYVGKWLYQVMGMEYDYVRKIIEELPYQMFPETATWGLMYHELKWQLPVRENLSYEERRKLIYQKRDCRTPMTPYRMEQYVKNTTGIEISIADAMDSGRYGYVPEHPNIFKAYYSGENTLDSKLVHSALNQLKQSHTAYVVNHRVDVAVINLLRISLQNIKIHFKSALNEQVKAKAAVHLEIDNSVECIGTVELERRRNLWYLNGDVPLNGSRILNALYEKEEL